MQRSYVSSIIDAPVEAVWKYLRPFDGLMAYHQRALSVDIVAGDSPVSIGCVRRVSVPEGRFIEERLLGLSDTEHSLSYNLLTEGLAFHNYVATIRLHPITDGNRTFMEWSSTYELRSGEMPAAVHKFIEVDVYLSAIRGLQALFI